MLLHSKNTMAILPVACLLALFCFDTHPEAEAEQDFGSGNVAFAKGFLSIDARETRSEDIMKEIGEKCGIKVVVYGEVFSEVPISLKFKNMPVRKGIKRVLRMAQISNYLMHFERTDDDSRIIEIDLIGKKGGEKHLTSGSDFGAIIKSEPIKKARKDFLKNRQKKKALKNRNQLKKEDAERIQENFLNIMDQVLKSQLEDGEEPDPIEILKLFKEVVPPEMKDLIPPEVLEELERLE